MFVKIHIFSVFYAAKRIKMIIIIDMVIG